MKITIQGTDYTSALDVSRPLTIERKLNEPSVCTVSLSLPTNSALATPLRNQSLTISGDDGVVYFTGYIAVSPLPEYAGLALEGPRYRIAIQSISDEMLLDQLLMPPSTGNAAQTAGALLTDLVTHAASPALSTAALTSTAPISSFIPDPGAPFSKSAGQVAAQARSAYRALSGALTLATIPGVVHTLNETDGSLTLANLALTASTKRALANDMTVCGEHEPVAYVAEYFQGDGVTNQFYLAADPFFPAASQGHHHPRALQRAGHQPFSLELHVRQPGLHPRRVRPFNEWRHRVRRTEPALLGRYHRNGRNASSRSHRGHTRSQ